MLENARRQFTLTLLSIVAAVLCAIFMKPLLGPDLKGGNQLIYEVPEEVLEKLGSSGLKAHDVMAQTVSVIAQRIDPTGVLDALVSQRGHNGVLIELPWAEKDQLDIIKSRIASLGKLEMRVVATDDFTMDGVSFELAKEKQQLQRWLDTGGKDLVRADWHNIERFNDDLAAGPLARMEKDGKQVPALRWVPHVIQPRLENAAYWDPPFSAQTQAKDGIAPLGQSTVTVYDQNTEYNSGKIPDAMIAANKADKDKRLELLEFVAINYKERHFRGEDLDPSKVAPSVSDTGGPAVSYSLKPELHSAYGDWSQKYIKKHSAIILNGVIRSAPYFINRIPGTGQISGGFTDEEVKELVKVLQTGSLQVEPILLSDRTTGSNLGERALFLGSVSLVAGTAAVFGFMIWYYKIAGVVACVTLLLQMLLTWAALLFMQATITLPGLGGLVLSMGMAVDANVLIYERIREESDRGKDMLRAVRAGFERAMSAILDSNITTFLCGLVLYSVGFGPVRGFAVTLMIGIVTTVFTQFFVTRLCFHWLLETKRLVDFKVRRFFAQPNIDYFKYARGWILFSIAITVGGLAFAIFIVPTEVSLGIDFKGGANLQMQLQAPTTAAKVRERLEGDAQFVADFRDARVNTLEVLPDGTSDTFNVRVKLTDKMRADIDQARESWRKARRAAEDSGQVPPAAYEPPYLLHLKRIFANELAKPASDNSLVVPGPLGQGGYASLNVHFQSEIDFTAAMKHLTDRKLANVKVTSLTDAAANRGKDVLVQWTTSPTTRDWQLFDTLRTSLDKFTDAAGGKIRLSNPFPEAEEIQGRMVGELRNSAIGALILAWALIILYLRVRFHEYKWGIGAVLSLLHDVLVALAAVVVCNYYGLVNAEIDLNMIACFLTIIGYSVNDTIVIFDRIRENAVEARKTGGKMDLKQLINLSINQTLSRTFLTSGVTLFTVLAQFVVNWGTGTPLESFSFGMMIGIITGTYSSMFIAAPMVLWIQNKYGGNIAGTGGMEPPADPTVMVAAPVQAGGDAPSAGSAS